MRQTAKDAARQSAPLAAAPDPAAGPGDRAVLVDD